MKGKNEFKLNQKKGSRGDAEARRGKGRGVFDAEPY